MNPIQSPCSDLKMAVHKRLPVELEKTAHFEQIKKNRDAAIISAADCLYSDGIMLGIVKTVKNKTNKAVFNISLKGMLCKLSTTNLVYFVFRVAHFRMSWGLERF